METQGQGYDISNPAFRIRAYDALTTILVGHIRDPEIEILPPSLSPADGSLYVVDGRNVGIPKVVLKAAFLEAVQRFIKGSRPLRDPDTRTQTAIILLFDPEHLTAANYRKRSLLASAAEQNDPNLHGIMVAVYNELTLLNTILRSPLHRQTKSPTLWYHRWWLFSRIVPKVAYTGIQGIAGGGTHLIQSELSTILVSAERHPNNYYTWQYARRLFTSRYMEVGLRYDFQGLSWTGLAVYIVEWCLKHPSDTSGWSFLLWMLLQEESNEDDNYKVLSRVLDFGEQVDWKREALWYFLRIAAKGPKLANRDIIAARVIESFGSCRNKTPGGKSNMDAQLSCSLKGGTVSDGSLEDDLDQFISYP